MKRITYLAAAGALVATSGLGAWAANAATSDAPAAHTQTSGRQADGRHQRHAPTAAGHRHHGASARGTTATTAPTTPRGHHRSGHEPGDDSGGGGRVGR
jgi:hypothetical protein